MKVLGFIGFMMISVVGTWQQSGPAGAPAGPDVASFLPGELPHSPVTTDEDGCD